MARRLTLLTVLATLLAAPPAVADSLEAARARAWKHLAAWDIEAAGKEINSLSAASPANPAVMRLQAHHAFLRGRYAEAVSLIMPLAEAQPGDKRLLAMAGLYASTHNVVKDFKEVPTSGGHFILAFTPGVDEVLVRYADQALEQAYERLGEIFRFRPAEPIRVEIYPRVSNLADVSPLKESEIRATGTIALCKYNRLMIVSPRALVYGYDWLDTLAHEYIHLLVTRRSRNTVPIWLHEGMARFFQNRWRETTNATLEPTSEDLLVTALKDRKLIRFEAMSPSMAKLPTQEDAALAFAEVFMVMELLYDKGGVDAINTLLDQMRDGKSDRQAVERVVQKSFKRFQREWKNYLYKRNLKPLPTTARNRLLFKDKASPKDELDGIVEDARNLSYLGDRLAVRKRFKAAAKEYTKALALLKAPQPIISAKLAAALLKQGKHRRVVKVVTPALAIDPNHVLLYLYRGKARLAVGDYEAARVDLAAAIRRNPFDPEVHELMAKALTKLGRTSEAEMERRHQLLLTAGQE